MAKIDISREVEMIAERKRDAEYAALKARHAERERKLCIIAAARDKITAYIQVTKERILKDDVHAFLERNMWRYMGQVRYNVRGNVYAYVNRYANLEFFNCIQTFSSIEAVELTLALIAARKVAGTLQDLEKLGVAIPKVNHLSE